LINININDTVIVEYKFFKPKKLDEK